MKSIYFTPEHLAFRDEVRRFVDEEILPHASDWEAQRSIPRAIWQKLGEAGYLGLQFPEEVGGLQRDLFYSVILWEELGRSGYAGVRVAVALHAYMATPYLCRGSVYLQERYLKPAIQGESISGLALTEPHAGSDLGSLQTRAVMDGDVYIVNGAKKYIIHSTTADFFIVAVKTGSSTATQRGATGVSLLVVDGDSEGLQREPLDNIGYHCTDTGELLFDDVRVPAKNLIGRANQGFLTIMKGLQLERLAVGCLTIGGIDRCLDDTWDYLTRRNVGGQPISQYQAVRHRLADLVTQTEAVRQYAYHTAWLHQQGELPIAQCSMLKLNATELASRVVHECMQFHGAHGYQNDVSISRMARDTHVATISAGASEVMRDLIAQTTLDGPGWRRKS